MGNQRILFLEEVLSTQDAAIEYDLQAEDACVSFHQSAGRGRRGNEWNSKGGVAVTVVLQNATPYLPIAVAATLAAQLNNLIPEQNIGIKWPNDLFVEGKKLAGILIEQREDRWLVGVGLNLFASPLPTACFLQQFGAEVDSKEHIPMLVVGSVLDAAQLDENTAVSQWQKRDILAGTTQFVQSGDNTFEGLVLNIDPCHNLLLQTAHGILELPAATSAIINDPAGR
ncbi:MAG: biotin--[acetyl-CoA-carboxylase] ligase [Planctomycetes bacterium]|nr:biotin--[acetyl-CoA-carboxylase] ligase [Planctomycetota bacterium]